MIWTHIYDLLLKIATLFVSIFILMQIPVLPDYPWVMLFLIGAVFFGLYFTLVRTLATYLYCRYTLKMDVNLNEAKQLNGAFTPMFSLRMKWLPMKELIKVNDASKFQMALDIYKKWDDQNNQKTKQEIQNFKNAQQRTKVLTVLMYLLVGYFTLAGFLDWSPANYLTTAYCKLFNTSHYYPFLNSVLLAVPIILIFRAFDKNIK